MPSSEHTTDAQFPIEWLRQTSPYINTHRGKTFVVWFGGELPAGLHFANLVHDLTLLSHLGVRLVLVSGMRPQIDALLASHKHQPLIENRVRVTDAAALSALQTALSSVRCQIESAFSAGLPNTPMSGSRVSVCSGNFVVAQPYGVRAGIDYQHTGEVRKVRSDTIARLLDTGLIVLLSPVGYSTTGELFNLHAEDVATQTAIALSADKLIFLHPDAAIVEGSESLRELRARDSMPEASALPPEQESLQFLVQRSILACRNGVQRCHIVSSTLDGALLKELFTRDGSGLLIDSGSYDEIRPANMRDVASIYHLIQPYVTDGVLLPRSVRDIEGQISEYSVIEREGTLICCASLTLYEDQAEVGCLAVHPDFQAGGKASDILKKLIKIARAQHCKAVFALTTRSGNWFQEQGFMPMDIGQLPEQRQQQQEPSRGSKLYWMDLDNQAIS